jgi:Ca-activated chloride channel family protein
MRRITLVILISVACFNMGSSLVFADGMVLPEMLSADYLVVRYHHVTVDILDGHAVTRVEQEFYNPHAFPVNGRYLFPVPSDAILSRFSARVDGHLQSYIRQDAAESNGILYEMVAQRRDPSLLQYADWESLTFDLNLAPGGSRKMSLEYEEVLAPSGGLYRYRYVLSTERYSSQPLEQASITVDLTSSTGLSTLYSSSHTVDTVRLGPGRARVVWEAENATLGEDFELFFAAAENGFGGGLLTGHRAGRDHFLFLFAPEVESAREAVIPKDIVFVVDRSGSMGGEKIEQARSALHFVLRQLNTGDRFSIVGFDHRLAVFSPMLQLVEEQTLAEARGFVDRIFADGDTNLEAALQEGLRILLRTREWDAIAAEPRNASQTVVFLTDGLPTAGVTDESLIGELVAGTNAQIGARLHVFGVGYDVNTHLLDGLTVENRGTVTYVQPGESLEAALTGFYERIAQPMLTDLEITFEGLSAGDLYPEQMPDLFNGSSLLLAGRYSAAEPTVTVHVRGRVGEEEREYVYHFDLDGQSDHDFVPRLWATRRVGGLLDRVRVDGESAALVSEIRELGLGYGLVTPYTTLFIEAQIEGAASAANMALYANQAALNQAWGQTTVQARVQNQLYQMAAQADLANGANVANHGQHSLAQIGQQQIDLTLVQRVPVQRIVLAGEQQTSFTPDWVEQNIDVDREIVFASEEYFELATNPEARPFLQSGTNVVFDFQGEVISVQEKSADSVVDTGVATQAPVRREGNGIGFWLKDLIFWLIRILTEWVNM